MCGLTTCCKSLTTSDKTGRVQQTVSTVILVTLSLASALSTSQSAVAQDDESEFIRPDVVRAYSPSQPELLAERVFLSKDEFLKLYRLAYPEGFNDKNAPNENRVVAAFYKSDSRAQIKDSNWSQRFTARFVIRSYSNSPANVPLPIGLVAIQSAKLDGNEAILAVETNQVTDTSQLPENAAKQQQQAAEPSPQAKLAPQMKVSVRVPAAGLHVLDVVFDVPAVIENSVGRIDVPLLPVAAGTVLFELPDKNAEVQINSRSNTFRKDGETLIIPIASLNQLSINWRPSTTQDTTNVIYHATVNSALTLDNTGLTAHAAVTVNCRQGQIS